MESSIKKTCGYNKKFHNKIQVGENNISNLLIMWCSEHCVNNWGWYFEVERTDRGRMHKAFLSFEDEKDLTLFLLTKGTPNG